MTGVGGLALQGTGVLKSGEPCPPPLGGGRFQGVGVLKNRHNGRGVHENTEVTVVDNVVDFGDLKRSHGAGLLVGSSVDGVTLQHCRAVLVDIPESHERGEHVLYAQKQVEEDVG